jgi:alpha-methylacyl-CoA racemase
MGPLAGVKIIEMKGIGPGPYAGMLLADMGAEVIVVERSSTAAGIAPPSKLDINSRGKKSIALNLKTPQGLEALLKLVEQADVFFECYRPGVAERLGFGPDVCLQRNPRLVYGRMTGWGQTGPLANAAGHDINYISLTGSLAAIGSAEKPAPPLNLVGDYAGGSLFLVMGILAALFEAQKSGQGQVIDAAIVDGSASLMSIFHTLGNLGLWSPRRNANMLDGGAHFYDTYETADGKFVSIGSIEPQFYAQLLDKACLDPEVFKDQGDMSQWPLLKQRLVHVFKSRTRQEWCDIMEGTDVCFAPVLDFKEAPHHPHNQARATYIEIDGLEQPAPAPRFSRTACATPSGPVAEGADTEQVLSQWGFDDATISALRTAGALS